MCAKVQRKYLVPHENCTLECICLQRRSCPPLTPCNTLRKNVKQVTLFTLPHTHTHTLTSTSCTVGAWSTDLRLVLRCCATWASADIRTGSHTVVHMFLEGRVGTTLHALIAAASLLSLPLPAISYLPNAAPPRPRPTLTLHPPPFRPFLARAR